MKLQWFAEIQHRNGETVAILFDTPAEEGYREVVRRGTVGI